MIINTFNAAWFIMLGVLLALTVAVMLIGKGKSYVFKRKLMLVLYVFIIVFYIAYKGYLVYFSKTYKTSFWNELPLALCQVASLFAYPAVASKNRTLLGFSFFTGTLCSFAALLMPVSGFYNIPLLSFESIGYYGFHILVFVICINIYLLGLYNPQVKDVPKILLFFGISLIVVHIINTIIRATVFPASNYYFTYFHEDNPVLKLLWGLIPVPCLYLVPMLLPVGLVYCGLAALLHRKKED